MELAEPPGRRTAPRRLIRLLVAGALVALALFCVLVYVHAYTSSAYLVPPIYFLGGAMVVLASASILDGIYYALREYPQHRKAVVFIVCITAATLVAHAYVIGSPSAFAGGSVSGNPSAGFHDGQISVQGGVSGNQLQLTVTASGGNAVASLDVSSGGVPLSGDGFGSPPSFAAPLRPGSSVQGTWYAPSNASEVTVQYQYLTCYASDKQAYGCIMDEVYYVPEGMAILNGQQCTTTGAPTDCHLEHPFMVPALLAAGMAVFGQYDVVGWRLMPALLGTFSLPLLFGISWKLSESKKVAALATLLLALDVMFFAQSSAGLLDVPQVFFILAAFFAYFANLKWWRFDRYVVAGVLMGVAGLAKETAVFAALALLTYILFFDEGDRWVRLYQVLKVTLVVGVVFAAGLQAYDSTLAQSVPTFATNVSYILSYGSSLVAKQLACSPVTGYWCMFANNPGGAPILPMDWLVYYSPVAYYLVSVTINPGNMVYVAVGYYGVTNLLVTWSTYVWVPLVVWNIFGYWKARRAGRLVQPAEPVLPGPAPAEPVPGAEPPLAAEQAPAFDAAGAKFGAFALIFFAWTYVPYIFLFIGERVTYPFYIIPAIPAIAMGAAYWLSKKWFPKWLLGVYLAMVFVFFLVYFPDKGFLPVWLRVLMRH